MIQYIALMGGETALNRKEHNIAFDYVAADIVLSSGIPLFMGTWDITAAIRPFDGGLPANQRLRLAPAPRHGRGDQALASCPKLETRAGDVRPLSDPPSGRPGRLPRPSRCASASRPQKAPPAA